MIDLFPRVRSPYYIYAPPYTHNSSGVRALHLLCHALNTVGEKAYLNGGNTRINPYLKTPILTPEIAGFYNDEGLEPIVIYPDIVVGNPMQGSKVVRYLLAPAGEFGGDKDFGNDMVWSYTTPIARSQNSDRVLTIPTVDKSIFHNSGSQRNGTCFYSNKYDRIHGNELLPIMNDSIRLEGSAKQIASILRRSEKCYVYEMSEIILCAQLCGCPVEIVQTDYFSGLPYDWDFPSQGIKEILEIFWHGDFFKEYMLLEENFHVQLSRFIRETQA